MEQTFMKDQLLGFCVVADVCVRALVTLPDVSVVADVRRVGEALGSDIFVDVRADEALTQRFHDRFLVPVSPVYVPLFEDSIRGAEQEGDALRYGAATGKHLDHVVRCYDAVGFDWRAIGGFDLAVQRLKATSLAAELAFMAALANEAADGADEQAAERSAELLQTFAREHAERWFASAADYLRSSDDDFYARVCSLAAEAVESLKD